MMRKHLLLAVVAAVALATFAYPAQAVSIGFLVSALCAFCATASAASNLVARHLHSALSASLSSAQARMSRTSQAS